MLAPLCLLISCTNLATPDFDLKNPFTAQVPFVVHAKNAAAASVRSVSLLPLGTVESESIARAVESSMIALKYKEAPFYSKVVVDRAQVAATQPQVLQALATADQTAGVLSILYGGQKIDRRNYSEPRSSCSATQGSGLIKKCAPNSTVTTQVACTERIAAVAAEIRMYDAQQRRTVYADTLVQQANFSRCSDATTSEPGDNDLVANARGLLVAAIQRAVAPTTQLKPLDMREPDAKIRPADQPAFQQALSYARSKRLDEACSRFTDLYDGNKESASLTYNVAFCDQAAGDLVNAQSRLKHASELANGPDSQIDRRLNAVDQQIKEVGIVGLASRPVNDRATPFAAVSGSGRRVALVVGNARYARGALTNPVNDARLMETQLKKVGFDVTKVENVDSGRFLTVVKDFVAKAQGSDVALFYYAGHAVQIGGENLLLPIDNGSIRDIDAVKEKSINLQAMLQQLQDASSNVRLVILDSCRDNPLPSLSRSLMGGMAPVGAPPSGELIAFATRPGETAPDGDGRNSVFTKTLARVIDTPNLSIEEVFKQVRIDVQRETKSRQMPTEVSSLTGSFYFRPSK